MKKARIAVVMGSDSDIDVARTAADVLDRFGVDYEIGVMSAHRSPEKVWAFATSARDKGFAAIIAIAGGAAHLAGVIASATTLPVIGVPVATNVAGGLDSLLSTAQMPAGVPVLAVGTGSGGAANAAHAAVRILSLQDPAHRRRLDEHRRRLAEGVEEKDLRVKAQFGKRKA